MPSNPVTKETIQIRNVIRRIIKAETAEQKIARLVKEIEARIGELNAIDQRSSYSLVVEPK